MNTVLDIKHLTQREKIQAMEELWCDLTQGGSEYPSPDWHIEVLKEREDALAAGKDEFVSLEAAKKLLRENRP